MKTTSLICIYNKILKLIFSKPQTKKSYSCKYFHSLSTSSIILYPFFPSFLFPQKTKDLRATETGGRNWRKIHLSTMLPSLNNRFCESSLSAQKRGTRVKDGCFRFHCRYTPGKIVKTVPGAEDEGRKREKLIEKREREGIAEGRMDKERQTEKELHNGTYTVHDADHQRDIFERILPLAGMPLNEVQYAN